MGDIFGGAQLIISWLGPEDQKQPFHAACNGGISTLGIVLTSDTSTAERRGLPFLEGLQAANISLPQPELLVTIVDYSRASFVKAQFFLCGDWVITPKELFPIYGSSEFQDWALSFWNPQSEARGDIDIPNNLQKLVVLFHWTGEWHCQKPQDKIYRLLGLVKERMEVDYTKSLEELAGVVLEMAEPLMVTNLKYWVSMSIRLVDSLEKALEVELHTCSTVPKLWVKVLKGKSNSDQEIVLKESSWDYRD